MTQEALKLALEGVEIHSPNQPEYIVCAALIEALAKPEQEPVAWQWLGSAHFRKKIPKNADITAWSPVYSAPQRTWVGLTDEELHDCLNGLPTQTIDVYARRIEAKLKEKNT